MHYVVIMGSELDSIQYLLDSNITDAQNVKIKILFWNKYVQRTYSATAHNS